MYSQNNEEHFILNYFEGVNEGNFIDIGAFDGITFSNTYALLERGWRGNLYEPSPYNFIGLLNNTEEFNGRARCHLFGVIAHDLEYGNQVIFFDTKGDAISTTKRSHLDNWPKRPIHEFRIHVEPLDKVIRDGCHLLNIDVEGESANLGMAAYSIMQSRNEFIPMVIIEHDGRSEELKATYSNYEVLLQNGENIIFALPKNEQTPNDN